jgi:hypothetical protein
MGNSPCCAQEEKDDDPKIKVKVKDVYCCDNIHSSCCIRAEKKHNRHRTTTHTPRLDPHR